MAKKRLTEVELKIIREELKAVIGPLERTKKRLTEVELKIIREELEAVIGPLDEGVWDTVKQAMVNWTPNLEVGGKITGRKKRRAAAQRRVKDILDKHGDSYVRDIHKKLTTEFPNWPNSVGQEGLDQFHLGIASIITTYDAIAKRAREDEKFCEIAEPIIVDLINYVRYVMDYKLKDYYKHAEGGSIPRALGRTLPRLEEDNEKDEELLDESFDKYLQELEGVLLNEDILQEIIDEAGPRRRKLTGRTFTGRGGESASWKGIKSRLLPALLALGGAMAALGHILMGQEWFINLLTGGGAGGTEAAGETIKTSLNVQQGEGPVQTLGRVFFGDAAHYTPGTDLGTLLSDMSARGVDGEHLAKLGANPEAFAQTWNTITTAPGVAEQPLSQVFGAKPVPGLLWHPTLTGAGVTIAKIAAAQTAVAGVGAGIASFGPALMLAKAFLPWAAGGLALSAAAVLLLRKKGEWKSRLATLQWAIEQMKEVPCKEGPVGKCTDEEEAQGKVWRADLEPPRCDCPEGQSFNEESGKCEPGEPQECAPWDLRVGKVWRDDLDPPRCDCPDDKPWNDELQRCGEGEPGKCTDEETAQGKVWDEERQECVCPPDKPWDEKLQKCGEGRVEFEGPYKLKINAIVEPMIRKFAEEHDLEIDENALEELVQGILDQNWAGPQANKGRDYFDLGDPSEYAGIAEAAGDLDDLDERAFQRSKMGDLEADLSKRKGGAHRAGQKQYHSKKGHVINVGTSKGRSNRHRSLNWHLTQAFLGSQATASDPLPGATDKEKRQLIRKIVKAMKADLVDQGAEVSQQQQQQEAKHLAEAKELERWKVLSGIK